MKNKISKQIFRRAVLPLVTLTFLSSTALGVAESVVNGGVSAPLSNHQAITKGAVQQKTIAAGKTGETLSKQTPSQKSSRGTVSSDVQSLISRFESWANKVVSTVKTVIVPKLGTKTQSITVKKQSPVVKGAPSTNLRPLPQVPVVKKEVVQPIETEKQLPRIRPQGVALPIEEPTSKDVETMASLLVSKPVVSEVTEAEVPPPPPLPKLGVLAPSPSPAEVQSASDAVDELATAIKETTTINDEIGDTEQAITKLMLQKQTLNEESLQGAEKQNVLLSNLKTQQTEPVSRESFLESIRSPHVLRNVSTQPKKGIVTQSETLLDTLKQSLAVRRVEIAEEEVGEEVQELSSTVESATLSTSSKKTVDEVIIDNLAAIEAAQMKIAALKPTAELPLETGFSKQIQQQNRARSQAIKEIEKLNGEINAYNKNNSLLIVQKTTRQEEITSKQQKVLSKLKVAESANKESFLESIRNRANISTKEVSESTIKVPQKQEVRSAGDMKSLEEKIKEVQKIQELKHSKLSVGSHHTDEDWE